MVAGAAVAVARGQDNNSDQLNYHFYSAFAYATGRLDQDVAPAQVMHSYLNPIVYLPFYYMVRYLPPRAAGMGLGALHGLNFWLVFVIARIVTRSLTHPARLITTIAAVVISAAAPMAASEFGTSLADIVVSLPALAGLALLMQAEYNVRGTGWTVACLVLSGALMGAAVSLKLTSAPFAFGLAIAALAGWNSWRHRLTAIAAVGRGCIAGFGLAGGSWYLAMWRMFHNPVFPYFNAVFLSPDYPRVMLFDARYVPHNILQAMSYPFLWARIQQTTTELPFRDIRFAALAVLGAIAIGALLRRRGRARDTTTPAARRLILFFVVAFGIWMYEWSIQRYIVGLELLTGPVAIVLLQWSGLFTAARGWALAAGSMAFAVVCLMTVRPIDWGHLAWGKSWYTTNVPSTNTQPAIYFIDGASATSYLVQALPPASPVIGIINWENIPAWGDTVFTRRIHAILAHSAGSQIWAIAAGQLSEEFKKRIALYGLTASGPCQTTEGRPSPLTWCRLSRSAPTN